jgi:phosphatidylserine decarboxylase precursor
VRTSLHTADQAGIKTLPSYFAFLDELVVLIPRDRNLNPLSTKFYYLIGNSPQGILQSDPAFCAWTRQFAEEWGSFLDTTASAAGIETFYSDPTFHMADFQKSPSGWLTFNQFFARQVKPGRRPVDGLCDDHIVVSPADSVYQGQWTIHDDSTITAKGLSWSVIDLLAGSPDQERFRGGVFTHSFLDINDYHRFHVPVAGVIKEARKIPGNATMDVVKDAHGTLQIVDGTGYQFTQDRGLIVMDSPLGLVAVLPIGMAQVSSVNLTAEVGAVLPKGAEFGFFAFGGSDIVMLFEANRVEFEAHIGTHYQQGRRVGHASKR